MTEVEKMRNGLLADMSSPELQVRFEHAKKLLARMRGMSTYDEGYRKLLEELVPRIPETSVICPPFYCDHGDGIKLGEHVFVNANCTFLDGGYITIGAHTLIGPCVQIYTPHHPMDYLERRGSKEYAYPVAVGEDCFNFFKSICQKYISFLHVYASSFFAYAISVTNVFFKCNGLHLFFPILS